MTIILFPILLWGCALTSENLQSTLPVEISGVLQADTTLRGNVTLTGDLLVPKGVVLRIEEGTTIHVAPSDSTKIDPEYLSSFTEILVHGSLKILGRPDAPVTFIPLSDGDAEVQWAGILFDGATDSVVFEARILQAESGILCVDSSPRIEESTFERCRYAIITQKTSRPLIVGNQIREGEGGVFSFGESTPVIRENHIENNEEEGIFVARQSRPVIESNVIRNNAIGIALYPRDLSIDVTQAEGNVEDVRLLLARIAEDE